VALNFGKPCNPYEQQTNLRTWTKADPGRMPWHVDADDQIEQLQIKMA